MRLNGSIALHAGLKGEGDWLDMQGLESWQMALEKELCQISLFLDLLRINFSSFRMLLSDFFTR